MDLIKQIAVYGDSILKGVMLDKSVRYFASPDSVAAVINQYLPVAIRNNARFGCTIQKGYDQLKAALNKGLGCDIVLLEYGGNDCDYNWAEVSKNPEAEHLPNTPLALFEQIYRKILNDLKEKGIRPLMMTLPPIDAEKYINWICRNGLSKENILRWLGDTQMIYRFQELYSNTVMKLAVETGNLLVDVRSRFLDRHDFKNLICEDGIHPNEHGHKLIQQAFVDFAAVHLPNPSAN